MPPNPPPTGKRKEPPSSGNHSNAPRKRAKTQDARSIAVQSSDAALSKTGELDVSSFVQAREYEIRALEDTMSRSKKALSTRAFQQVPRQMRRRTASHNVKMVPKRLRDRAAKEMKEDNTPTVNARTREPTGKMRLRTDEAKRVIARNRRSKDKRKDKRKEKGKETDPEKMVEREPRPAKAKKNTLSDPPKAVSKFKKRQKEKTWLPTHLYHAKRAHMTPPNEPLWRFAIPLTPTEKSYRPTHRASSAKGAVAWDTSYMATMRLEGVEKSLEGVLKGMGFGDHDPSSTKGKKLRDGVRVWSGWMHERDGEKTAIAPVVVIWCARPSEAMDVEMTGVDGPAKKEPKRCLFIRVHPSAFLQLWTEVLKVSKMQRPKVVVEDLRFEIGSIEITGPGSTEALLGALRPFKPEDAQNVSEAVAENTWTSLAGLTNPAGLPSDALLAFDVSDPRLHHPPRTIKIPSSEDEVKSLTNILASWPPDKKLLPASIFDRNRRLKAARDLRSQQSINRRKSQGPPGEELQPLLDDPCIPVLLFATRCSSGNSQATWTVLLPWKCVSLVWNSLMYYPLSTGGNPLSGGLREKQQIYFEANEPWFPGDFPGTAAGMDWEMLEREKRKTEWSRRPKGRRAEYDTLNLGNGETGEVGRGWACDWEFLLQDSPPKPVEEPKNAASDPDPSIDVDGIATTMDIDGPQATTSTTQDLADPPPEAPKPQKISKSKPDLPPNPTHYSSQAFASLISSLITNSSPQLPQIPVNALATIKITLPRGTPLPGARIYALPTNPSHRDQWLSLLPHTSRQKDRNTNALHNGIPRGPNPRAEGEDSEIRPPCPPASDLRGFVTTGGFNLKEGKGTAMGSVVVAKFVDWLRDDWWKEKGRRKLKVVVVRNSGEQVGRVGWWDVV
jgi:ribonuclease P/MRP protein subunit POP1